VIEKILGKDMFLVLTMCGSDSGVELRVFWEVGV